MTGENRTGCEAVDREHALAAFDAYVSGYDKSDVKIAIKVEHTLRVARLCERIGISEGLPPEDVGIVWLAGLLHDIGRFEQIRRFGTFNEAKSVSHAALGAQILFEDELVRNFIGQSQFDELLCAAVSAHSDFKLPERLDARTRRICDILRDADKLDILAVNSAHSPEDIFGATEEEMRKSALSPAVVDAFYKHQTIRRELRRHPADYLVGFVCFAYGLVYPASFRILDEQGCLATLLSYEFSAPETQAEFARMGNHLQGWLQVKQSERP